MTRSTTIWAAALLMAGFSGSGPMLTTAEAMPAPLPQETAGRPRYYFPRHVKRQVVTNTTAPASATSSSFSPESSSSSSSNLELRQSTEKTTPFWTSILSAFESQAFPDTPSLSAASSDLTSASDPQNPDLPRTGPGRLTTITAGTTIFTVTLPAPTVVGTGSPNPDSSTSGHTPLEPAPKPTSDSPSPPAPKIPSPQSTVQPPSEKPSSTTAEAVTSSAVEGSSGGIPDVVVQSTSSNVASTEENSPSATEPAKSTPPQDEVDTSSNVSPTDDSTSPTSAGSTGRLPTTVIQPTPSSQEQEEPSSTPEKPTSDDEVGSTQGLPSTIVQPTSATPTPEPTTSEAEVSSTEDSPRTTPKPTTPTVQDPPTEPTPSETEAGSTGGLPSSIVQPTSPLTQPSTAETEDSPAASSTGALPSAIVQPTESPSVGSTGGIPETTVLPSPASDEPSSASPTASGGSTIHGPFIVPTSVGALPTSSAQESDSPASIAPSIPASDVVSPTGSTGGIPPVIVLPTSATSATTEDVPSSLPNTGIVVGITTAFGTSETVTPTPTDANTIPTSESKSETDDPFSSFVSELSSVLVPSETGITNPVPGPTAPTTTFDSSLPTGTGPATSETLVSGTDTPVTSATPTPTPTVTPSDGISTSGVFPPSATVISSGTEITLFPTGTSGPGTSTPEISTSTGIPVSEDLSSTTETLAPTSLFPSATNGTLGISPTFASTGPATSLPTGSTSDRVKPSPSSEPPSSVEPSISVSPISQSAVMTLTPTATDGATVLPSITGIQMEPSTASSPSPTPSASASPDLPAMIQPPAGPPPSTQPPDTFFAQVGFKWPLNYAYVASHDGGRQIFEFLPRAIADALNVTTDQVPMWGIKPFDTTAYQGFVTTLALFYIPADLNVTLAAQMRNPADALWHNEDPTVNALTEQINTAFPLAVGSIPESGGYTPPNKKGDSNPGGAADGGPIGGDMNTSHKINPTSAGIATGAVVGAFAYGAAMFFVARRYRKKRMSHKRASSVPTTRRHTYGSMQGGFIAGARGPSRNSGGSGSSQGRSVRTQQISAPVMAENSLGWN